MPVRRHDRGRDHRDPGRRNCRRGAETRPAALARSAQPRTRMRALRRAEDVVLLAAWPSGRSTLNLTPRERDKLMIALAAIVARGRLARGVKLNYPESIALISDAIMEGARDGRSVADLIAESGRILTRDHVMDGLAEMIREIQVEATFPDGTKLVPVHSPIR